MIRSLLASVLLIAAMPSFQPPQESPPRIALKELCELRVVVEELSPEAQEAGLSDEDLKAQTIVAIKRNLPTMRISDGAYPFVVVAVTAIRTQSVAGRELGYVACVDVKVMRPVNIMDDSATRELGFSMAILWTRVGLYTGTRESIARQVKDAIEGHLTKFAADYYQQNGR